MHSLSFSVVGLRPWPPSSFLSLSRRVQPSILIALLLGSNIIGDRRDGRPAFQLPPSTSKNRRRRKLCPRIRLPSTSSSSVRKECTVSTVFARWKAAPRLSLALSLSFSSVSYRLVEDTFFHPLMHLYNIYNIHIYIRSIGIHGIEEKRKSLSWRKKVFARGTSIRVTSLMATFFQCSTDELEILF